MVSLGLTPYPDGSMSQGDGTDRPADATAGAWAAAAIVLALGALVFGVVAELHAHDLSVRVTRLEHNATIPTAARSSTTSTPPSTEASAQPANPEQAEQQIDTAFATVYDGSRSTADRLSYIDDPVGVEDAFSQASTGSLALVTSGLRAEVSRITFTSSVTATVSYSLTAAGSTAQRLGSARLAGGAWKVSRATVCSDLSAAGVACSS
jgi:hypothetical protein